MAFLGYLIKVGSNTIPLKYISLKSYKSTPNRQIDLDTYRDADGFLRRNILPHRATTIEFSTPYLHLSDKIALQSLLPSRTKLTLTYWNDETNEYTSGNFYIPDVSYDIYQIDGDDIIYMPIAYKFIEY
jgi:hypothetical protein